MSRRTVVKLNDIDHTIGDVVARDSHVTNAKLAAEVGCSQRTIIRHLNALASLGDIVVSRGDKGQRILTIHDTTTSTSADGAMPGSHNNAKGYQASVSGANFVAYQAQVNDHLDFVAKHRVWVNEFPTDCMWCGGLVLPGHGKSIEAPHRPKGRAYVHGIDVECTR